VATIAAVKLSPRCRGWNRLTVINVTLQNMTASLVCYKQWMRAAIPYIAVLIAIGLAIWFAVGNPLQP
jgi:hypothetical protein